MKKALSRKKIMPLLIGIFFLLCIFAMTGCSRNKTGNGEKSKTIVDNGKVTKAEITNMPVRYAKGFNVTYLKDGIKKVTDGEKRTLILVPRGKDVPVEYKNDNVIYTPIQSVLTASTTQTCLLRPINEFGSVAAVTNAKEEWQIDEIKKEIESGKIKFVGKNTAPDYEKIAALKPEISFLYTGPSGLQNMATKFNELNIKYAVDNEYLEEDPLGRMEWIKFIATFYNKEEVAEKYFDQAESRVKEVAEKVKNSKKTKVAWAVISKGSVYVPRADSYAAKMIELAGGEYIFKYKGIGSEKISLEEFYAKTTEAELIIYASSKTLAPTLQFIVEQAPALPKLKAVENKKVWCLHPDYWQSSDKIDESITDLARIFHPEIYHTKEIKHFIKYEQ